MKTTAGTDETWHEDYPVDAAAGPAKPARPAEPACPAEPARPAGKRVRTRPSRLESAKESTPSYMKTSAMDRLFRDERAKGEIEPPASSAKPVVSSAGSSSAKSSVEAPSSRLDQAANRVVARTAKKTRKRDVSDKKEPVKVPAAASASSSKGQRIADSLPKDPGASLGFMDPAVFSVEKIFGLQNADAKKKGTAIVVLIVVSLVFLLTFSLIGCLIGIFGLLLAARMSKLASANSTVATVGGRPVAAKPTAAEQEARRETARRLSNSGLAAKAIAVVIAGLFAVGIAASIYENYSAGDFGLDFSFDPEQMLESVFEDTTFPSNDYAPVEPDPGAVSEYIENGITGELTADQISLIDDVQRQLVAVEKGKNDSVVKGLSQGISQCVSESFDVDLSETDIDVEKMAKKALGRTSHMFEGDTVSAYEECGFFQLYVYGFDKQLFVDDLRSRCGEREEVTRDELVDCLKENMDEIVTASIDEGESMYLSIDRKGSKWLFDDSGWQRVRQAYTGFYSS